MNKIMIENTKGTFKSDLIGAPTRRDVTIYHLTDGEFLVERPDGTMTMTLSTKTALAVVKADDKHISKRTNSCVVTTITWIGLPSNLVTEIEGAP